MNRPGVERPSSTMHPLVGQLPALLQQDITIVNQGTPAAGVYVARVLGVVHTHLTINLPRRLAGNGYLRESTPVIVNFVLGDRLYEARADYRADGRQMREIIVQGDITATTRRRYTRLSTQVRAGYVPVSELRLRRGQLGSLPWKQCLTRDLSGGGALIQIPFQAPLNSYLLVNLEIQSLQAPLFIFGQVRWFGICDLGKKLYSCGIMFIPREDLGRHFSTRALSELPPILQIFDRNKQKELDAYLSVSSRRENKRRVT